MEDWVERFRLGSSSSAVLSRISLGLSGLSISGSLLMGLSLNPSISLSRCVSDEKRKEEQEREIGQKGK